DAGERIGRRKGEDDVRVVPAVRVGRGRRGREAERRGRLVDVDVRHRRLRAVPREVCASTGGGLAGGLTGEDDRGIAGQHAGKDVGRREGDGHVRVVPAVDV